ncbi:MAG TPA: hypothetical protein PKB11_02355 [Desulfovibrio sp.]|jgi:Uncharacterized conserved protein|uniref:MotE family protein n=1 Tax=Desulfovibrio TaxID=872 RepID=UPI001FE0111E|nr:MULTISPECIES: hypothetical protein [Desulfovibrio]MDY0305310.1 hypothetical protein [Desulfovibrionaceae bacterium]HMM37576.1 hypothetical protein [Desulfovibrio sp.]
MSVRPSRIILWVLLLGLLKLGLVGAAGLGLFDGRPAKADRPVVAALEPQAAQAQTATPPAKPQDAAQKPAQDAALPPAGSPADWKILKQREEDLASKERSLKALEQNLDDKLVELKALEKRIQAMLDQADVLKDEKLKHLVDVYSNMKSKQAAAVLETLDDALAVKILSGMRGRTAGEILSNVRADRAAVLTEALTRLQAPLDTPGIPSQPKQ